MRGFQLPMRDDMAVNDADPPYEWYVGTSTPPTTNGG
jgi:hypothetical protein